MFEYLYIGKWNTVLYLNKWNIRPTRNRIISQPFGSSPFHAPVGQLAILVKIVIHEHFNGSLKSGHIFFSFLSSFFWAGLELEAKEKKYLAIFFYSLRIFSNAFWSSREQNQSKTKLSIKTWSFKVILWSIFGPVPINDMNLSDPPSPPPQKQPYWVFGPKVCAMCWNQWKNYFPILIFREW